MDTQAVKISGVGGPERGYDRAKRLSGRKRHLLWWTLLMGWCSVQKSPWCKSARPRRWAETSQNDELAEKLPRLAVVWADAAYRGRFRSWVRDERGWRVEVPRHPDQQLWRYGLEEKPRGFLRYCPEEVGGREDIFAWLGQTRRLAKDYERLPESAVAMIYWAMRAASCSAGSSAQLAEMPQEGLGRQL